MILEETIPSCLSGPLRWALAATCALTLGLSAAPATAQQGGEPPPRVEIRIDGKAVEELSPQQRERLLRRLGLEGEALQLLLEARQVERRARGAVVRDATAPRRRGQDPVRERRDPRRAAADPSAAEDVPVADLVQQAVEEARRELATDPDLKELGITDDVLRLLDTVASGRDFRGAIDAVVDQAIRGVARKAQREIADDEDLRELGIADDLGRMIGDLAGNAQLRQGLRDMAGKAMRGALAQARREILADPDLQQLGIAGEVAGLLDGIAAGRLDLDGLGPVIQRAVDAALQDATQRDRARDGARGR